MAPDRRTRTPPSPAAAVRARDAAAVRRNPRAAMRRAGGWTRAGVGQMRTGPWARAPHTQRSTAILAGDCRVTRVDAQGLQPPEKTIACPCRGCTTVRCGSKAIIQYTVLLLIFVCQHTDSACVGTYPAHIDSQPQRKRVKG